MHVLFLRTVTMVYVWGLLFLQVGKLLCLATGVSQHQKDSYPVSLKLMLVNEKYAKLRLWGAEVSSNYTASVSPHLSLMPCPTALGWSGPALRELLGNLCTAGKNAPCFQGTAVCWLHCTGTVRIQECSPQAVDGRPWELRPGSLYLTFPAMLKQFLQVPGRGGTALVGLPGESRTRNVNLEFVRVELLRLPGVKWDLEGRLREA